eukprot:scaffold315866_cov34-Prasinocladus_malaysianus.AAC.1
MSVSAAGKHGMPARAATQLRAIDEAHGPDNADAGKPQDVPSPCMAAGARKVCQHSSERSFYKLY